ncbi:RND transporter [Acinetobacter qingfengensis]|uniref:Uncharacterized protein n=1 Tax=Acinetobacter qingfengensis TaxID=1262585 RepID=A0A1E7R505_9GAMM|nr:TolC family protein [Acinetobacter qingfengensis]KAA8732411.1 RND transporter [Acinetobacter qingfengensis]OEY94404.1 hypothetical protein BJI46_03425 [Acinetobacter qingfengensis]
MRKFCWLGLICYLPLGHLQAMDLIEAYQRALAYDASWQANQLRYRVEQQNLGIAQAAVLPTVSVNASIDKQYQNENSAQSFEINGQRYHLVNSDVTTRQVSASIRQPIFRLDVWQKYKQVKISTDLAELKLQYQQQQLMLNVATAYFDVLRQQQLLAVYRQEEQALFKQLQMMQAKYKEGLIARIDVSEANAQYQSAVAKRTSGEVQSQLALEQLQHYTGKIYDDLSQLSSSFQYQLPIPNQIEDWQNMALRNNLELNQTRLAYQVALQQVKVDQADAYPQVEMVASSGWNKQSPENILSQNGRVDKVGVELNWTPFLGTRQATLKKSQISAEAARVDIAQSQNQIQTEVKRNFLQVVTASRQLNAYKAAQESAQLVADASQASYQEGLKTMVDVLLAQRNAFSATQDYVNAQYDYLLNVLQLRASSGQLTEADLKAFNAWLE